jgi:hypothetical protein
VDSCCVVHLSDPERRLGSNVYPRRAVSNELEKLTRAFNVPIYIVDCDPDRALRPVPVSSHSCPVELLADPTGAAETATKPSARIM